MVANVDWNIREAENVHTWTGHWPDYKQMLRDIGQKDASATAIYGFSKNARVAGDRVALETARGAFAHFLPTS